MTYHQSISPRRLGFTLIELMVAMALTLFIMTILSQAFTLAIDTFSALKGIGDMQVNLGTAATALRADLMQDHLDGKRRLSDADLTTNRPREGFLVVYQGSNSYTAPNIVEGPDADGIYSSVCVNHVLHLAAKRRGNRRENYFRTPVADSAFLSDRTHSYLDAVTATDASVTALGTGFYASPWAEVAYYLLRTGTVEEPNNPNGVGLPLYGLYRAEFVVPPTTQFISGKYGALGPAPYTGLSCNYVAGRVNFYAPADLASGRRAFIPASVLDPATLMPRSILDPAAPTRGATLVLPNVLSFQVQVLPSLAPGTRYIGQNFSDVAGTYDTQSASYGLTAVKVTLRVWDYKSRQTRQTSTVNDL